MGPECSRCEIEIAAAAGEDLPAEALEHVERCSACAALREEALALASVSRSGPRPPPATAAAILRRAVEERARPAPVWAVPCLSASASAAALILYFGMFRVAGPGASLPADGTNGTNGATREAAAVFFEYAEPEGRDTMLPDSLRAVRETLLGGSEMENEQ